MANPQELQLPINPRILVGMLILILLIYLVFRSFVIIDPTEQGVVLRLGKFHSLLEPGPHILIPIADQVFKVETKVIHKEEFGYRSQPERRSSADGRTQYSSANYEDESLIVTGDLNMAEVEWSVQYQIEDPRLYLFNVHEPVKTLRDLSESVICRVVGDRSVYEILTVGRTEIEDESKLALQAAMDQYETGIKLVALKLQNVLPPDPVKPSYNEVNEAEQYRERLINEAQKEYNSRVPRALGQAKQRMEQAEGYKVDRVNRALGEANKFVAVYQAYNKAKEVTRQRMYLEAMNDVLTSVDSLILVDEDQKSLLPLLNLNPAKGGTDAKK